ncbi:MAG: gluconate 2-dehydrogenase subunit 3 family protein [Bryobacteraceae bacterium]
MERREILRLISLSAIAPAVASASVCASAHAAISKEPYRLRFFTAEESKALDEAMEIIIPADGHSPGAHAAKVNLFVDWMVDNSGSDIKKRWRSGLLRLREQTAESSIGAVLAKAASNEEHPVSELDGFFVILKQMAVDGYYTSEIGIHQDMQYQGNDYLLRFPGCTHPEHQG